MSAAKAVKLTAAAGVVAGAIALVAGGSPSGRLAPENALAQAAQQTARAASGVARTLVTAPDGATFEALVRFDGDDAEATLSQRSAGGAAQVRTIRVIDGVMSQRLDGGAWTQVEGDGAAEIEALRAQIANPSLVQLAQSAASVTQSGDVYQAQVPAAAVGTLEDLPLGFEAGDQPEAAPVTIAVGDDGLVRSVTVDTEVARHELTYSELNQPQAIAAP